MHSLARIGADRTRERAMDIEEARSDKKIVGGETIKTKRHPRRTTKITCLLAARTNGYWLLKRGRRMRCHEALRA